MCCWPVIRINSPSQQEPHIFLQAKKHYQDEEYSLKSLFDIESPFYRNDFHCNVPLLPTTPSSHSHTTETYPPIGHQAQAGGHIGDCWMLVQAKCVRPAEQT